MTSLANTIITLATTTTTTTTTSSSEVKPGTSNTPGGIETVGGTTDLKGNVINIINGVLGVLGLVCVVVIIIGGVNYMTSSGDAGKVKKARDTILYGVIGMIVCVLAFAIVNFVLNGIIAQ